jgi:hypothetical protein
MAHTNEDYEYQTASQYEDEERVAQTLVLPETREPLVVEQFLQSW